MKSAAIEGKQLVHRRCWAVVVVGLLATPSLVCGGDVELDFVFATSEDAGSVTLSDLGTDAAGNAYILGRFEGERTMMIRKRCGARIGCRRP